MKKTLLLLCVVLLLTINSFAYTPVKCLRDGFSVGAEWIYFSPTSESVVYADIEEESMVQPTCTTPFFNNRFDDFYSGYRVFGAYGFCTCDSYVSVSWTDLKANHSDSVATDDFPAKRVNSNLIGSTGFQSASEKRKFRYWAVDGVLGRRVVSSCCFDFAMFLGVHYARLHLHDDVELTAPDQIDIADKWVIRSSGTIKNNFWGVGPEIGASLEGNLGCGFSLQGIATGAFIIGNPDFVISGAFLGNTFEIPLQSSYRTVPYADIRLQANYAFTFPCFCWGRLRGEISVGYEGLSYFDALVTSSELASNMARGWNEYDPITATDASDTNYYQWQNVQRVIDFNYRNVTMHGPFISVAIAY